MAFIGILAYLFFFFIRLQDWWGPLKGVPVDDIVISFIIIFLLPSLARLMDILKLPQSRFLLLFVISVFLSNIVNGNIDASLEYGWKYLKFAITFFVIVLSVNSFPKLKSIAPYAILLVTFIAYQGIIMAKTGTNWAGSPMYWGNRIRWEGLFDGANSINLAFIIGISFILGYFFGPWGKGYKLFSVATGSLIITGVYLSNSRGGFLSVLVVLFSFIATKIKNKKGLIFGFILAFTLFNFAAPSRMSEIDDPQKSTRGRIHAWEEALQMVRYHNPLFGVGKGQFTNYTTFVAHNAFSQQLGETGLIGAFFWLGLIYATIKGLLNVLKKENLDPLSFSLYRGYFLGLIGLLAGAMFISADHELLYIWMALCTSIMLIEGVELRISIRDLKIIGVIEIAGVIGAYIAVNLFKAIYF